MKSLDKNFINIFVLLSVIFITGCGLLGGGASKKNPRGQLVGTTDRQGFEMSAQYGMVYIPTGRFYMDNLMKIFKVIKVILIDR